jgi:hypothetical protein
MMELWFLEVFSIDPLYKGKLLIGLYNLSSSNFPLLPGKKLIAAMFYRLQEEEIGNFRNPDISIYEFPEDLIHLMEKYKPISTLSLMNEITSVRNKLEELKNQFRETDLWFKEFQKGLSAQEKNIDRISDILEKEVDERRRGEDTLQERLNEITKSVYRTAAYIGIGGALIITFLVFSIQQLLSYIIHIR